MYCVKCGKQITDDSDFCQYCGAPQPSANEMNSLSIQPDPAPRKKKRGCGCLIATTLGVLFLFGCIVAIVQTVSNPEQYGVQSTQTDEENTPEEWLEFDERTWNDFVTLYKNHNAFMNSMTAYSNGQISSVDMYQQCEAIEEASASASVSLDYGTNDEEDDYLSVLKSMALSDQAAAKDFKTYLDSKKTSDLSSAQTNIQAAVTAATMFSSNRGTLLTKAGLSDEEIEEKVNADAEALSS